MPSDQDFMQHALRLARRGLGQTWPNPAVGALVVKGGAILGRGWTATGGRPHAEPQALKRAGDAAGATLYVTLEPCAHHGKTPPCTEGIINAGIARVVIACRDPNRQVNGRGIAQLRDAGIEVEEGVCAKEAENLNAGFFRVQREGLPFVALKIATSLDGNITTGTSERWLTGEAARAFGQYLRAEHDAIVTGSGTVIADDPLLTCRLPGLEHRSPVRVVLDRRGRIREDCAILKTAKETPVWVFPSPIGEGSKHCFEGWGLPFIQQNENVPLPTSPLQGEELHTLLKTLAARGITRVLVEAGQGLNTAFLESGLVNRIYWLCAPLTAPNGLFALKNGPLTSDALNKYQLIEQRMLGGDVLRVYER